MMLTKRKCFLGNNVFVKKIRVVMLNCMICIDCVFYYNTRLNSSMYWFSGECDFFLVHEICCYHMLFLVCVVW